MCSVREPSRGLYRILYRPQHGQTIDFLLTENRDKEAALRFLKKAIRRSGVPETITIDGSDANEVIYLTAKPKFKLAPKANAYGNV